MKIKAHHKIIPEDIKTLDRPILSDDGNSLFDWDSLCKNLKSFWEDLFEDIE